MTLDKVIKYDVQLTITSINCIGSVLARIVDLGLVVGSRVLFCQKSIGGVCILVVNNVKIALRQVYARQIEVELID